MSESSKCKDNLNFCAHYGAAEKNQEKNYELLRKMKEKLKLSAQASQYWLLRRIIFFRESENSNVDNFFPECIIAHSRPF